MVRDHGTGIQPRIRSADEDALGIGLSVIQALVHRVEFKDVAGSGTEVRMEFATPSTRNFKSGQDGLEIRPVVMGDDELATTTRVAIAPTCLARTILPRILSVLAVRAHFSTDRISDTQLVADALAADASALSGDSHLSIAVSVEPRDVELRIGPLVAGRARQLIGDSTLDGLGTVIEKLTDDHKVSGEGSAEMLALRLIDQR